MPVWISVRLSKWFLGQLLTLTIQYFFFVLPPVSYTNNLILKVCCLSSPTGFGRVVSPVRHSGEL